MFDFRQAFIDVIEANQREWSHDRSFTLGASEAFGCLRRSWYLKHDPDKADPELMSMGAAARGNLIEDHHVVPCLRQIFGEENVLYAHHDQESFVLGLNSATPDSLIINQPRDILAKYGIEDMGGDCFATEIKSFDPRMSIQEEKAIHKGQGIIQLGMFRELTPYKPDFCVVLYTNAADLYDVRPFVVEYDEQVWNVSKQRAKMVFDATDPYELRAEGMHTDQCRYCPFIAACRGAEAAAHVNAESGLTPDEEDRLDVMAAVYRQALADEKVAKQNKSEASEDIKRFLNACGTKKAKTGAFRVSHAKMDGKETLDYGKLRADGINPDDYKKVGAPFTRLNVSEL